MLVKLNDWFIRKILNSLFIIKPFQTVTQNIFLVICCNDFNMPNFVMSWGFTSISQLYQNGTIFSLLINTVGIATWFE